VSARAAQYCSAEVRGRKSADADGDTEVISGKHETAELAYSSARDRDRGETSAVDDGEVGLRDEFGGEAGGNGEELGAGGLRVFLNLFIAVTEHALVTN
jgi:hypothetical protein